MVLPAFGPCPEDEQPVNDAVLEGTGIATLELVTPSRCDTGEDTGGVGRHVATLSDGCPVLLVRVGEHERVFDEPSVSMHTPDVANRPFSVELEEAARDSAGDLGWSDFRLLNLKAVRDPHDHCQLLTVSRIR